MLILGQRDDRWAKELLGTSKLTLGGAGCAVACVAMWLNNVEEGRCCTPSTVNKMLVLNKAFRDTNLVDWDKLPTMYPVIKYMGRIDCPNIPAPLPRINTLLNDTGVPVIVYVDSDVGPLFRQHFVLILRQEGDNYVIADPWTGKERLLAKTQPGGNYYGPTAAVAICGVIVLGRGLST